VKASANKRKLEKKVVRKETKAYQERLNLEITGDREEHGKRPFPPDNWFQSLQWFYAWTGCRTCTG